MFGRCSDIVLETNKQIRESKDMNEELDGVLHLADRKSQFVKNSQPQDEKRVNYLLRSDSSIKDQLKSFYPENPQPRKFRPKPLKKKLGRPPQVKVARVKVDDNGILNINQMKECLIKKESKQIKKYKKSIKNLKISTIR